jgi:hypothetical protein
MDYQDDYGKEYSPYMKHEKKEYPVYGKHEDEMYTEYQEYDGKEEKYDMTDDGYDHMKKQLIEVEKVVGMGSAETFLEVCVPLCPPAIEVPEGLIDKKIVIDTAIASHGKVFINGRIIKNIPYKTRCETIHPPCGKISSLTFGNLKHATFTAPFALCINVPHAKKGDKVVVLEKKVTSVEIPNFVRCGVCEPSYLRKDTCTTRLIKSVTEKDCIFIKVKVVEPMMMHVPGKYYTEECGEMYHEEY